MDKAIWRFDRMIPIEAAQGGVTQDFASEIDWRAATKAARRREPGVVEPISYDAILREEHHNTYGRPWLLGRFYAEQVKARIKPSDRVLDLGCGSGRVGIWLVPWLEQNRYFGVDAHLASLVAFAAYEAVLHDLLPKRPRLLHTSDFEVDRFDTRFDVVLDFYVTKHLRDAQAAEAHRRVRACCAPGARLLLSHEPPTPLADMLALGWSLSDSWTPAYPVPVEGAGFKKADHWHEFVAV